MHLLLISTQFYPTIYYSFSMNLRVYLIAALLLTLTSSVQVASLNAKPSANPNCTVNFCTTCVVASTCDVCDPSYYLQANTCSSCDTAIVGCVTCAYNAVSLQVECSACDTAYTLTAPTTCSLCSALVANCATCTFVTPTTTCNTCASGYYLLTNACLTCISAVPNCLTCSYNPTSLQAECSACAATYVLTTPTTCALCSSFVPNCISCTYAAPTATCNACDPGFYLSPTKTCMPCTTNFANCALCTDSAVTPFQVCTQCVANYLLIGGICEACSTAINQCVTCNQANNTCDTCIPGDYRKSNGQLCSRCSDLVINCALCTAVDDIGSAITCSACDVSTFLRNNTCISCSQLIISCVTCDSTNNTCTTCSDGNYRKDGGLSCNACSDLVSNCILCNATTDAGTAITCRGCSVGFFLSLNTCLTCGQFIPSCTTCNTLNNTCDTCADGNYRKSSGTACAPCTDLIPNCGLCTATTDAGTAITCTFCVPGTFAVANTCLTCSQFITNCATCNDLNSTCDTCATGFYRINSGRACTPCTTLVASCAACTPLDDAGSAITCSQCAVNTYLKNNACVTCALLVQNCVTCNALNNTCDTCSVGNYRKASGAECQPCGGLINSCTTCAANDDAGTSVTCSACALNTYLLNNACVGCPEFILNCLTCNNANNTCDTCAATTFRKSGGQICAPCTELVANCTLCQALNDAGTSITCTACSLNTFLVANVCLTCSQFISSCVTCNNINKTCDACLAGNFRKNGGASCAPCTDLIGNCTTCVGNDQAGTSITCSQCVLGTFLVNNVCLTCSQFIPLCVTCNTNNNTCDVCLEGSFRSNNGAACLPCSNLVPQCTVCASVDEAGSAITCSKCNTNLFLLNNTCLTCGQFIASCNTCNTLNNTCDTCSVGFYRKASGAVCSTCNSLVSRCTVCQANDEAGSSITCTQCAPDNFLVANTCLTCPQFIISCITCNSLNNTCDTCSGGTFRKDSGADCAPCTDDIDHCVLCTPIDEIGSAITCNQCAQNTFLLNNTCVTCDTKIPHCLTCSVNQTCLQCGAGYYASLDGLSCLDCSVVEDCTSCVNDGFNGATCRQCDKTLIVSNNTCVECLSVIPDCSCCVQNSTDFSLICNGCRNGKIISDDNKTCVSPPTPSSSNTAVIVSAAVGGTVAVLGASFAIYKCITKKKAPLADDYEKI